MLIWDIGQDNKTNIENKFHTYAMDINFLIPCNI